ncbi:hypothetical protein ACE0DR_22845 [Azotobacter sp. CWF10]
MIRERLISFPLWFAYFPRHVAESKKVNRVQGLTLLSRRQYLSRMDRFQHGRSAANFRTMGGKINPKFSRFPPPRQSIPQTSSIDNANIQDVEQTGDRKGVRQQATGTLATCLDRPARARDVPCRPAPCRCPSGLAGFLFQV